MRKHIYRRGRWITFTDYPTTPREDLARERVRKWEYQRRWTRFPQLGPIPTKWMDVGPRPAGGSYINEALIGYYSPVIRDQINTPSPLLQFLNRKR